MKSSGTVDDIIAALPFSNELRALRTIILSTGLIETIKWGAPVYTYDGRNVVGIAGFKNHFGLWFHQGSLLQDKHNKLINAQEGRTKMLRQWRMQSMSDIDKKMIVAYIKEAIDNEQRGVRMAAAKPIRKAPTLPKELTDMLSGSVKLSNAFGKLTPGKQKEYADFIADAKQAATKSRRLDKIKPLILAGKSLNDQYM